MPCYNCVTMEEGVLYVITNPGLFSYVYEFRFGVPAVENCQVLADRVSQ